MTLREVISQVIKLGSGGVLTDETRYDLRDIEDRIHFARALAIQNYFSEKKRISSEWIQTYNSPFDSNIQSGVKFARFKAPSPIVLDSYRDGFVYVGDSSNNIAYRRVNNRAELSNYNSHRYTKLSSNVPKFIYENGYIDVYGNSMIKELLISGVFSNPTSIPNYNQDVDNYPVSDDLIIQIKDIIFKTSVNVESGRTPDLISNSNEVNNNK